jgi:acetolactate synthase I/III small subunit
MTTTATTPHHLFTIRVENKAGVLLRVASLFARRGFNIVSLAVAPTDDERFSKISIVVDAESAPLQQVREQLDKLINVVHIDEIVPEHAAIAELLLAAVRTSDPAVEAVIESFGATVLQRHGETVTVMLAAAPDVLNRLESELCRFGLVDLQRTGQIAIATPA